MTTRIGFGLGSAVFCVVVAASGCASEHEGGDPTEVEAAEAAVQAQWVDAPAASGSCKNVRRSDDCSAPLAPGVERMCRIGGRSYTVRAGRSYDPCKPAAVVVDVPNLGTSAEIQLGRESFCVGSVCWSGIGSGWAAESDTPEGGFLVVVPERMLGRGDEESNFFTAIVNELKRVATIDESRVFVSGLGQGGDAALEAACRTRTFRGVSPNAGGQPCPGATAPIPAISFASRADGRYRAYFAASERLADLNQCKRGPVAWRKFDSKTRDAVCRTSKNDPRASLVPCSQLTNARLEPTTCQVWTNCKNGADVVFCDVASNTEHGAVHTNSDALIVYQNNTNLNTPSVAWRFFQQFEAGI